MRGINRWIGSGMTRRSVLKGLGAGAVATAAATRWGKVYAGSEVTLNLLISNMPWCEAMTSTFAEEYNKATNGRVSITGVGRPEVPERFAPVGLLRPSRTGS